MDTYFKALSYGCLYKALGETVDAVPADEADFRRFLDGTEKLDTQGDMENAEAVLQVSISANRDMYQRLVKEKYNMCQALTTSYFISE